jgi:hypothetical protein
VSSFDFKNAMIIRMIDIKVYRIPLYEILSNNPLCRFSPDKPHGLEAKSE